MSAVLQAREPTARYLEAMQPALVKQFDLLGSAPGGVSRLRELILTLAVQGKLAPQLPSEEPASLLLRRIESAKERLVAAGEMKRPKLTDEIAEDELPFPTPTGWQWVRLGILLQKIGAGSTPLGGKEVYVPSGVKFIRSQNVWNDGLRLEGVAYISHATHSKMAGTVVVANDLLFNITGASIGRCAAVPADFDEANVSQHVTIIRPVLPSLNAFLHTVLISRLVQQAVMDVQVGVSREGLSIAKLGNFLVPIPPLQEQARIVARVDELMRLCDALEVNGRLEAAHHQQLLTTLLGTLTDSRTPEELAANWQRVADHFDVLLDRPEAVDALEQTVLQLAVRGLLVPQDSSDESASVLLEKVQVEKQALAASGRIRREAPSTQIESDEQPYELPAGWQWVRLRDIWLSSFYGPRFGSEEYVRVGGIPTIRTTDMTDGEIVLKDPPRVQVPADKLDVYQIEPGDLLVTRSGSIGVMALFHLNMVAVPSAYLIRIRFSKNVDANYCLRFFLGDLGQSQLGLGTTSVGVPNVSASKMANFLFPLPPRSEQTRIVARVDELRRLCSHLRKSLATRQTTQSHLAEALVAEVA